jgi:radical SAM protein with 4Fe4S-binding SPASM domain
MLLKLAKELVVLTKSIGVKQLLLIGGEPTLWGPLFDFNKFCLSERVPTILITNGVKFAIDNFWENYRKNPNDKIGISVKALTPQQLLEVTGFNNFSLIKKGISRGIQELEAQVSITYNKFYTDSLVDMVKFAVDCGAKSVKIDFCSTVFTNGHPEVTYMVEPKSIVKNIMRDYPQLERITKSNVIFEMMVPFCLWPIDFLKELVRKKQILSVCHVHKKEGIIFDENGKIIMCNALFDYPIGSYGKDFNDGKSFLKWINSSKIVNYYNLIGRLPSEKCGECDWYIECGGGCPLRWAIYKPDEIIHPLSKKSVLSRR